MKYVRHYRIEHDDIIQVEYADNAVIPDDVPFRTMPFPDLKIVKSLGHGDGNPFIKIGDEWLDK